MAYNYINKTGLQYIWNKIKAKFVAKDGDKVLSDNNFTDALKTKLDGIATGANKTTVDTALSSTSTNPVQNKVVNSALGGKLSTTGTAAAAKKLATARSRGLGMSIIFQNIPQLQNRYPDGQWEEILGGCDISLFLGCNDMTTATYYSERSGDVTVGVSSVRKNLRNWQEK